MPRGLVSNRTSRRIKKEKEKNQKKVAVHLPVVEVPAAAADLQTKEVPAEAHQADKHSFDRCITCKSNGLAGFFMKNDRDQDGPDEKGAIFF